MNNTYFKRVISSAVAMLMLAVSPLSAFAESSEEAAADNEALSASESGGAEDSQTGKPTGKRVEESYRVFYDKYAGEKGSDTPITLTAAEIAGVEHQRYRIRAGR